MGYIFRVALFAFRSWGGELFVRCKSPQPKRDSSTTAYQLGRNYKIIMSFTIESYTSPDTVVVTLLGSFDVQADTPAAAQQFAGVMENFQDDVYLIIDFRAAIAQAHMDNIMIGPFLASQAENPMFTHPKVREILFVAVSEIMKHVANGLNTSMYGSAQFQIFSSVEDALDYARNG